jgi:chromate transporter
MSNQSELYPPPTGGGTTAEVFVSFLRLGLTSFGGPIAHLGYFHDEFVVRRQWLDEKAYVDLVALSQFLPGPASTKVGIAIGLSRAGYTGALAAWTAFTLPSAIALMLFGYGVTSFGNVLGSGWLHGLKVAAVAVVANAVLTMMRTLAPDRERATLAVAAAVLVLAVPSSFGQIGAIVLGAVIGVVLFRGVQQDDHVRLPHPVSRTAAIVAIVAFFALLVALPLVAAAVGRGRAVRLGEQRCLPRRLRRRAGSAGSAVYVFGLSRHGHGPVAQRLGRGAALSRRDVSAGVSTGHRPAAVLG